MVSVPLPSSPKMTTTPKGDNNHTPDKNKQAVTINTVTVTNEVIIAMVITIRALTVIASARLTLQNGQQGNYDINRGDGNNMHDDESGLMVRN